MNLENLKNKRICVVGLLSNGHKLVRALANHKIKISGAEDFSPKEEEFVRQAVPNPEVHWIASHGQEEEILEHDLIVTSPGYQKFHPILKKAEAKKIPIIAELDFLSRIVHGPIVGITGTQGKSTVVEILKKIFESGKLGHQIFGGADYDFPDSFNKKDQINIFELSSSKLAETTGFHPHIAVLTNLALAHQERHHSREEYFKTKARIFTQQNPKDFLVYNALNGAVIEIINLLEAKAKRIPFQYSGTLSEGIYKSQSSILWKLGEDTANFSLKDFKLLGPHNVENLMAAVAVAKLLNVSNEAITSAIKALEPLAMRLEPVSVMHGVKYFNDARSATPAATSWALHTLKENVILLAGGIFPKGARFEPLLEKLKEHCKILILFGDDRKKFHDALGSSLETYLVETVKEAVNLAYQKAQRGDSVLFSPMSLPELRHHRSSIHRGQEFAHCVEDLKIREKTRKSLQWELNKI